MLATLIGLFLVGLALQDCFETVVLPRRVTRRWRLSRIYFRTGWQFWQRLCRLVPPGRNRENALSVFGPLALLGLIACWVGELILGFALLHWGGDSLPRESTRDFRQYLYHSGETFFTLGYGDVTPATYTGKFLAVIESGMGFGFMAIVIGYLPVLYQAFSSREQNIGLLDARAGSPPTAGELLRRFENSEHAQELERFLAEWEAWCAQLLESHLSFPVLTFYRSQHDNQSWLAALAMILDASAVMLVTGNKTCRRRAELTFAMARHTCVDLCLVIWLPPAAPREDRLTAEELDRLLAKESNVASGTAEQAKRLRELQLLYEPFLQSLADYFMFRLPRFFPDRPAADNWQTSAWTKRAPAITELPAASLPTAEHFG